MNQDYYELRYIETSSTIDSTFSLFDDAEDKLTLLVFIKQYDCILLLGSPGAGKTTELKHAFHTLWENKNENNLIPLYINIKKFKEGSTIEELIGFDTWKNQPAVIFLFDGLDEIGNIQYFLSKLMDFMSDYAGLRHKYVMSCRTNIYQKYIINTLAGFQSAYLKDLSYKQINSILEKKYELEVPEDQVENLHAILQTPFNLNLFANYYEKYNKFPESINDSWNLLTNAQIKRAVDFFEEKFKIDTNHFLTALKQVAITNELMQKSAISKDVLLNLLGSEGFEIFQELPFITTQGKSDNYAFTHKNYQEYFAAQYIAGLDPELILNFLKVEDLDKIRPNLYNTTTFLLNILSGEKLKAIIDWLFENDIELLFFAEDRQLKPEMQNEIFKEYFIENCVEKTYWISNNPKITIATFAKFASFDFLMEQLMRSENQLRARGSALEVMTVKQLNEDQKENLKNTILHLLTENDDELLPEILQVVRRQGFHKDKSFLESVLKLVKHLNNRGVNHQIISMLGDLDDDELNSEILLTSIKNYYSTEDNVIRATEYVIAATILKTNDKELSLSLIELLFDEKYSLRSKTFFHDSFDEKLLEKINTFNSDPYYTERLMEIAFGGQHRIMSHPLLGKIIQNIEITPELVIHIIKKENMSKEVLYNISGFLDTHAIDAIAENYKKNALKFDPSENIEIFRNLIANKDLTLGLYFQDKFIEVGYVFAEKLITQQEINNRTREYENFKQHNYNLLFDKNLMLSEINEYFAKNEVTELNNRDFQKLFWNWYDERGYHGIQYTLHTVLETALKNKKVINPGDIDRLLQDAYFYLSVIKSGLAHSSLQSFNLRDSDIQMITSLTSRLVSMIDFDDVIRIDPNAPTRFFTTTNFNYLRLVQHFEMNFDILQDKAFYLNSLKFGSLGNPSEKNGNSFFDHIFLRVNDKEAFNDEIVKNINEGYMIPYAKKDHITYAIKHNLQESFEQIGIEIKSDDSLFSQGNILEKYVEKIPNSLDFLKSCCVDPESYFYWYVIKIIKKEELDNGFILKAAQDYLEKEDLKFIDEAITILFFLNQKNAVNSYYKALDLIVKNKQDSTGIMPNDVNKYSNLEELDQFEKLFHLIYSKSPFGSYYLYQSRRFLSTLTAVLSVTDQGYSTLKEIFANIKNHLDSAKDRNLEEYDHKTYYLNELIDFSYSSYLKAKSEKLSFDQAVSLLRPLH